MAMARSMRRMLSHVRIAIVGTGPAGFYTAKYLLEKNPSAKIDMIEKLPVPFGLVRFGVAPDHPEVKSVSSQFAELFDKHRGRLNYFGNVTVGEGGLTVGELRDAYSAVIFANGASSDRSLNIKGEDLHGVMSARTFVNWYNGHPEQSELHNDFDFSKVKNVVVVGNGNVALDCARILSAPVEDLAKTDISISALDILGKCNIQSITMVGRRGHIQAAFTIKELRELTRVPGAHVCIDADELEQGRTAASELEILDNRPKKRIVELIDKTAAAFDSNADGKKVNLRFLLSPKEIISRDVGSHGSVSEMVFERNSLEGPAHKQTVQGTGAFEHIPCDLVLKAVGYQSVPMFEVPFNSRSKTVPSTQGRVVFNTKPIHGLYVTGWLKRGPSGIIGTNITDAKETVMSVLEDIESGVLCPVDDEDSEGTPRLFSLPHQLAHDDVVTWGDFEAIDAEEKRMGEASTPARERVKLLSVDDMMSVVYAARKKQQTSG